MNHIFVNFHCKNTENQNTLFILGYRKNTFVQKYQKKYFYSMLNLYN